MSDDQDECEWVSVSSSTGSLGSPGQRAIERVCVFICLDTNYICLCCFVV